MHVVVLGAGVIGAAVAEAIAARGASVAVLDMRAPGQGASQAAAGMLTPYIEADGNSTFLDLCIRSLSLYDEYVARLKQLLSGPLAISDIHALLDQAYQSSSPAEAEQAPAGAACDFEGALQSMKDFVSERHAYVQSQ